MQQIDTDKIMEEIRDRIQKREYKPADLTFRDEAYDTITDETVAAMTGAYNEREHVRQLQCMEEFCDVEYSRYTASGGVMGFIKKVIRRLATCAVLPVVEQINAFHGATLEAQMQMFNYIKEQEGRIEALKAENDRLKKAVEKLSGGDRA